MVGRALRGGGWSAIGVALLVAASACGSEVESQPTPPPAPTVTPDPDPDPPSCDDFLDDAPSPVEVVVENASGDVIVVAETFSQPRRGPPLEITDPSGDAASVGVPSCTCEAQQQSTQACVFSTGGPQYELTIIPAGSSHTFSWDGLLVEDATMPLTCFANQDQQVGDCPLRRRPEPGSYTVGIEVGIDPTGCADGPCACAPGEPSCTEQVFDYQPSGTRDLAGSLEVGTASSVTLTYTP